MYIINYINSLSLMLDINVLVGLFLPADPPRSGAFTRLGPAKSHVCCSVVLTLCGTFKYTLIMQLIMHCKLYYRSLNAMILVMQCTHAPTICNT